MWSEKYKIVGITPGPVYINNYGTVDFSDPLLPIDLVDDIFDAGCIYLRKKGTKKVRSEGDN